MENDSGLNDNHPATPGEKPVSGRPPYFHEVILQRELCEVYLLIDHLSGRWDKRLMSGDGLLNTLPNSTANAQGQFRDGAAASKAGDAQQPLNYQDERQWIERVCEIGWSDEVKSNADRAKQAADLILAKDHFNAAAKPASGMTIAFTLMVTGHVPSFNWWQRYLPGFRLAAPERRLTSRTSMAGTAFPGLVRVAKCFRWKIGAIIVGLLLLLLLTCLLSWNMSGGYAILNRLDAIEVKLQSVQQKLAVETPLPPTMQSAQEMLVKLCSDSKQMNVSLSIIKDALPPSSGIDMMNVCLSVKEIQRERANILANLSQWMSWWVWLSPAVEKTTLAADTVIQAHRSEEAWARVFVPLMINSVLAFLYGILGAGASVMRYLRVKTRESLLTPRDVTLVANQLVLGATIGGCIGLFAAQSSSSAASAGVNEIVGVAGLTGSALSFLAGFGVEGVFAGLESLVRRVFNLPDPNPKG